MADLSKEALEEWKAHPVTEHLHKLMSRLSSLAWEGLAASLRETGAVNREEWLRWRASSDMIDLIFGSTDEELNEAENWADEYKRD